MKEVVQVALPIPNEDTFSYSVPSHLRGGADIGKRVLVPFKNRKMLGFIVGIGEPPEGIILRDVMDIVDEEPLFDQKRLDFLKWVSSYYMSSLGIVLKAAHPGGLGISIRRTIKLYERKEDVAHIKGLNQYEEIVLKSLVSIPGITVERLFNIVDGLTHETLNSLRRKGLIEFDYELRSDPKIKTEAVLSPLEGSNMNEAFGRRSPAKAKIMEFILSHERVPYTSIKEVFGDVSRQVRELRKGGFIKVEQVETSRDPFSVISLNHERPPILNPDQEVAFREITDSMAREKFAPYLLHGVTGSGKTEVYLRVIENVIGRGKEAIVLVPEISLTPQLVKRFRGRFGKKVGVIHSALSEGDRFDAWRQASRGSVSVIIGARSAIFAPFKNLGIIVVDEEHEASYKQDESPCYNARDLALVLGKMTNSVVILGSATPSVETYANAEKQRFKYLSLPLRVEDRKLPVPEIVDMRKEKGKVFSNILRGAIIENSDNRKQTILFLNRRGFSNLLVCQACGEIVSCPNCSISLTYHARDNSIKCHYCGISEPLFDHCLKCGKELRGLGMGTQRIEDEVKSILPTAAISRMDRDAVVGKNKLLRLYDRLEKGEVDVLIGTQMVAKGHDLPGITLVGVVSADQSLGIPDFRAGERTFQLVTQVAGRAGRGDEPGRVIVQTFNPEHPSIKFAIEQDSVGFLKEELKLRDDLEYPPFSKLVNFRFQGRVETDTVNAAKIAGELARKLVSKIPIGMVKILGPSPAPIYKIRNRYRYQMLLKSRNVRALHNFSKKLSMILRDSRISRNVKIQTDVDPFNFN
jgi:primosomal protein N' (replication factor Y) (superfamily II helicase)